MWTPFQIRAKPDAACKSRLALAPAFAFALAVLAAPPIAKAQSSGFVDQEEYRICMSMVGIDANQAFERALAWEDAGGGHAARHCAGVALNALGHFSEAAQRLEILAAAMPDDTPPEVVAEILGHAGLSWQQAGESQRAFTVQSAALDLAPGDPALLVDRAASLFALNNYWEAIDDLNAAAAIARDDPEILVFRASAYRHVDALDLAMEDANRALSLASDHPEGLLERGILRRLTGDIEGARSDWLTLITLHEGRPAADVARRNLERMDLKSGG